MTVTLELADEARGRFLRVGQAMRRDTQSLSSATVTVAQAAVLCLLLRHGPLPVGELARAEGVRPPSMTQIVNRMAELDWVSRSGPAVRGCLVEITPQGRKVAEQVNRERNALLAERLKALSRQEQETLRAALPVLDKLFGSDLDLTKRQ